MGRQATPGVDDIKTLFPDLAKEVDGWDPSQFLPGSNSKQKWKCIEGHTWVAIIAKRTGEGTGCPYCSGRKAWKGFNDLATKFPDIASQADGWEPSEFVPGSNTKQKWKCAEGHTWKAVIAKRTGEGTGCPYCAGRKVWKGFNDLATKFPEIASEADGWDPSEVSYGIGKNVSWLCQLGHSYKATINSRTNVGSGCPYCSGNRVLNGFNDLKTKFPEIAAEADGWDPTTVTSGTNKKGRWLCKEGHRYSSAISSRTSQGTGCPICANKKVQAGVNDLATTHPDLAKSADGWDPTTVTYGSTRKVGWLCSEGHSFMAAVARRSQGSGCPYCSNTTALRGFNDLATVCPEIAKKQMDGIHLNIYLVKSTTSMEMRKRC